MILALLFAAAIPAPDLSGVLALMGHDPKTHGIVLAQACPIASALALTNRHVSTAAYYVWSAENSDGLLIDGPAEVYRDLALVMPERGSFPSWYPIVAAAPEVGDRLYFVGWDFRKRRDAFARRVFDDSRVVRVVNRHVVMYPPGVPGTSGSCVLNERGEVVGINKSGKDLDDGNTVGVAVGVWPPLLELRRSVQ